MYEFRFFGHRQEAPMLLSIHFKASRATRLKHPHTQSILLAGLAHDAQRGGHQLTAQKLFIRAEQAELGCGDKTQQWDALVEIAQLQTRSKFFHRAQDSLDLARSIHAQSNSSSLVPYRIENAQAELDHEADHPRPARTARGK